jgi:hypothetical protein
MFGAVERIERRKALKDPSKVFLFQVPLLHEVRDRRGEREHEERDAEHVGRDVER